MKIAPLFLSFLLHCVVLSTALEPRNKVNERVTVQESQEKITKQIHVAGSEDAVQEKRSSLEIEQQKSSGGKNELNSRDTRWAHEASSGTDWGGMHFETTNSQDKDMDKQKNLSPIIAWLGKVRESELKSRDDFHLRPVWDSKAKNTEDRSPNSQAAVRKLLENDKVKLKTDENGKVSRDYPSHDDWLMFALPQEPSIYSNPNPKSSRDDDKKIWDHQRNSKWIGDSIDSKWAGGSRSINGDHNSFLKKYGSSSSRWNSDLSKEYSKGVDKSRWANENDEVKLDWKYKTTPGWNVDGKKDGLRRHDKKLFDKLMQRAIINEDVAKEKFPFDSDPLVLLAQLDQESRPRKKGNILRKNEKWDELDGSLHKYKIGNEQRENMKLVNRKGNSGEMAAARKGLMFRENKEENEKLEAQKNEASKEWKQLIKQTNRERVEGSRTKSMFGETREANDKITTESSASDKERSEINSSRVATVDTEKGGLKSRNKILSVKRTNDKNIVANKELNLKKQSDYNISLKSWNDGKSDEIDGHENMREEQQSATETSSREETETSKHSSTSMKEKWMSTERNEQSKSEEKWKADEELASIHRNRESEEISVTSEAKGTNLATVRNVEKNLEVKGLREKEVELKGLNRKPEDLRGKQLGKGWERRKSKGEIVGENKLGIQGLRQKVLHVESIEKEDVSKEDIKIGEDIAVGPGREKSGEENFEMEKSVAEDSKADNLEWKKPITKRPIVQELKSSNIESKKSLVESDKEKTLWSDKMESKETEVQDLKAGKLTWLNNLGKKKSVSERPKADNLESKETTIESPKMGKHWLNGSESKESVLENPEKAKSWPDDVESKTISNPEKSIIEVPKVTRPGSSILKSNAPVIEEAKPQNLRPHNLKTKNPENRKAGKLEPNNLETEKSVESPAAEEVAPNSLEVKKLVTKGPKVKKLEGEDSTPNKLENGNSEPEKLDAELAAKQGIKPSDAGIKILEPWESGNKEIETGNLEKSKDVPSQQGILKSGVVKGTEPVAESLEKPLEKESLWLDNPERRKSELGVLENKKPSLGVVEKKSSPWIVEDIESEDEWGEEIGTNDESVGLEIENNEKKEEPSVGHLRNKIPQRKPLEDKKILSQESLVDDEEKKSKDIWKQRKSPVEDMDSEASSSTIGNVSTLKPIWTEKSVANTQVSKASIQILEGRKNEHETTRSEHESKMMNTLTRTTDQISPTVPSSLAKMQSLGETNNELPRNINKDETLEHVGNIGQVDSLSAIANARTETPTYIKSNEKSSDTSVTAYSTKPWNKDKTHSRKEVQLRENNNDKIENFNLKEDSGKLSDARSEISEDSVKSSERSSSQVSKEESTTQSKLINERVESDSGTKLLGINKVNHGVEKDSVSNSKGKVESEKIVATQSSEETKGEAVTQGRNGIYNILKTGNRNTTESEIGSEVPSPRAGVDKNVLIKQGSNEQSNWKEVNNVARSNVMKAYHKDDRINSKEVTRSKELSESKENIVKNTASVKPIGTKDKNIKAYRSNESLIKSKELQSSTEERAIESIVDSVNSKQVGESHTEVNDNDEVSKKLSMSSVAINQADEKESLEKETMKDNLTRDHPSKHNSKVISNLSSEKEVRNEENEEEKDEVDSTLMLDNVDSESGSLIKDDISELSLNDHSRLLKGKDRNEQLGLLGNWGPREWGEGKRDEAISNLKSNDNDSKSGPWVKDSDSKIPLNRDSALLRPEHGPQKVEAPEYWGPGGWGEENKDKSLSTSKPKNINSNLGPWRKDRDSKSPLNRDSLLLGPEHGPQRIGDPENWGPGGWNNDNKEKPIPISKPENIGSKLGPWTKDSDSKIPLNRDSPLLRPEHGPQKLGAPKNWGPEGGGEETIDKSLSTSKPKNIGSNLGPWRKDSDSKSPLNRDSSLLRPEHGPQRTGGPENWGPGEWNNENNGKPISVSKPENIGSKLGPWTKVSDFKIPLNRDSPLLRPEHGPQKLGALENWGPEGGGEETKDKSLSTSKPKNIDSNLGPWRKDRDSSLLGPEHGPQRIGGPENWGPGGWNNDNKEKPIPISKPENIGSNLGPWRKDRDSKSSLNRDSSLLRPEHGPQKIGAPGNWGPEGWGEENDDKSLSTSKPKNIGSNLGPWRKGNDSKSPLNRDSSLLGPEHGPQRIGGPENWGPGGWNNDNKEKPIPISKPENIGSNLGPWRKDRDSKSSLNRDSSLLRPEHGPQKIGAPGNWGPEGWGEENDDKSLSTSKPKNIGSNLGLWRKDNDSKTPLNRDSSLLGPEHGPQRIGGPENWGPGGWNNDNKEKPIPISKPENIGSNLGPWRKDRDSKSPLNRDSSLLRPEHGPQKIGAPGNWGPEGWGEENDDKSLSTSKPKNIGSNLGPWRKDRDSKSPLNRDSSLLRPEHGPQKIGAPGNWGPEGWGEENDDKSLSTSKPKNIGSNLGLWRKDNDSKTPLNRDSSLLGPEHGPQRIGGPENWGPGGWNNDNKEKPIPISKPENIGSNLGPWRKDRDSKSPLNRDSSLLRPEHGPQKIGAPGNWGPEGWGEENDDKSLSTSKPKNIGSNLGPWRKDNDSKSPLNRDSSLLGPEHGPQRIGGPENWGPGGWNNDNKEKPIPISKPENVGSELGPWTKDSDSKIPLNRDSALLRPEHGPQKVGSPENWGPGGWGEENKKSKDTNSKWWPWNKEKEDKMTSTSKSSNIDSELESWTEDSVSKSSLTPASQITDHTHDIQQSMVPDTWRPSKVDSNLGPWRKNSVSTTPLIKDSQLLRGGGTTQGPEKWGPNEWGEVKKDEQTITLKPNNPDSKLNTWEKGNVSKSPSTHDSKLLDNIHDLKRSEESDNWEISKVNKEQEEMATTSKLTTVSSESDHSINDNISKLSSSDHSRLLKDEHITQKSVTAKDSKETTESDRLLSGVTVDNRQSWSSVAQTSKHQESSSVSSTELDETSSNESESIQRRLGTKKAPREKLEASIETDATEKSEQSSANTSKTENSLASSTVSSIASSTINDKSSEKKSIRWDSRERNSNSKDIATGNLQAVRKISSEQLIEDNKPNASPISSVPTTLNNKTPDEARSSNAEEDSILRRLINGSAERRANRIDNGRYKELSVDSDQSSELELEKSEEDVATTTISKSRGELSSERINIHGSRGDKVDTSRDLTGLIDKDNWNERGDVIKGSADQSPKDILNKSLRNQKIQQDALSTHSQGNIEIRKEQKLAQSKLENLELKDKGTLNKVHSKNEETITTESSNEEHVSVGTAVTHAQLIKDNKKDVENNASKQSKNEELFNHKTTSVIVDKSSEEDEKSLSTEKVTKAVTKEIDQTHSTASAKGISEKISEKSSLSTSENKMSSLVTEEIIGSTKKPIKEPAEIETQVQKPLVTTTPPSKLKGKVDKSVSQKGEELSTVLSEDITKESRGHETTVGKRVGTESKETVSKSTLNQLLASFDKKDEDESAWQPQKEHVEGISKKLSQSQAKESNREIILDSLESGNKFGKLKETVSRSDLDVKNVGSVSSVSREDINGRNDKIVGWLEEKEGLGQDKVENWSLEGDRKHVPEKEIIGLNAPKEKIRGDRPKYWSPAPTSNKDSKSWVPKENNWELGSPENKRIIEDSKPKDWLPLAKPNPKGWDSKEDKQPNGWSPITKPNLKDWNSKGDNQPKSWSPPTKPNLKDWDTKEGNWKLGSPESKRILEDSKPKDWLPLAKPNPKGWDSKDDKQPNGWSPITKPNLKDWNSKGDNQPKSWSPPTEPNLKDWDTKEGNWKLGSPENKRIIKDSKPKDWLPLAKPNPKGWDSKEDKQPNGWSPITKPNLKDWNSKGDNQPKSWSPPTEPNLKDWDTKEGNWKLGSPEDKRIIEDSQPKGWSPLAEPNSKGWIPKEDNWELGSPNNKRMIEDNKPKDWVPKRGNWKLGSAEDDQIIEGNKPKGWAPVPFRNQKPGGWVPKEDNWKLSSPEDDEIIEGNKSKGWAPIPLRKRKPDDWVPKEDNWKLSSPEDGEIIDANKPKDWTPIKEKPKDWMSKEINLKIGSPEQNRPKGRELISRTMHKSTEESLKLSSTESKEIIKDKSSTLSPIHSTNPVISNHESSLSPNIPSIPTPKDQVPNEEDIKSNKPSPPSHLSKSPNESSDEHSDKLQPSSIKFAKPSPDIAHKSEPSESLDSLESGSDEKSTSKCTNLSCCLQSRKTWKKKSANDVLCTMLRSLLPIASSLEDDGNKIEEGSNDSDVKSWSTSGEENKSDIKSADKNSQKLEAPLLDVYVVKRPLKGPIKIATVHSDKPSTVTKQLISRKSYNKLSQLYKSSIIEAVPVSA